MRRFSDTHLPWIPTVRKGILGGALGGFLGLLSGLTQPWAAQEPFQLPPSPVTSPAGSPYTLHLQGLLSHQGQGVALINGELVRPGDTIQGLRLLAVHSDRVILEDPQGELVVLKIRAQKEGIP